MYPDTFVRCGPRDDRRTTTDDPVVVFEVLSEGTAKHDLIRKRLAYEAISGLRRIVYVSVDEARVDMRVRSSDGAWGDETVEGMAAVLELPEISASLSMAEVYEETELAAATAQAS
jgi:Uma2 family endonuclease